MNKGALVALSLAVSMCACAADPFAWRDDRPEPSRLVRAHSRAGSRQFVNGEYAKLYRSAARYFDTSSYYTVARDWRAIYADDFHGMYSVGVFFEPTRHEGQTLVEVVYEQETPDFMASGQSKAVEQSLLDGIVASMRLSGASRPGLDSLTVASGAAREGRALSKLAPVSEVDAVEGLPRRSRPNDLALIVGVEGYALLGDADYAARDAETFRKYAETVLGVPRQSVFMLTDRQAGRREILAAIEERLRRLALPDSRVWIYLAGYGGSDPATGAAYFLPYDADPEHLTRTGLALTELQRALSSVPAFEIVLLVDSSFGGFGGRTWNEVNQRPLLQAASPLSFSGKIAFLAASDGNEIARALEEQGHGLFTYYLLRGLRGEAARGGRLTLGGLASFVHEGCQKTAYRFGRAQNPGLSKGAENIALW